MSSRLDIVTGRMSKLMLKRWPMLADLCSVDGCCSPLMRNPATGDTKCVWHDAKELFPDEMTEGEIKASAANTESAKDSDATCKTDEKMSTEAEKPPALSNYASSTADKDDEEEARLRRERREQSDRASHLIAKRLLQGWKMIDRPCPNKQCYSVPLVEDRDRVQFCVICEQRYMYENHYIKKYGAIDQSQPSEAPAAVASTSQAVTKAPVSAKPKKDALVIQEPETTTTVSKSQKQQPQKRATESTVVSSSAVQEAIDALNEKIADLSARLLETTCPKDIVRISKAISSCAKAISKCQRLSN
ncbi:hypothetical protein EV178_001663 [Coemansia sp. RSA 1646]|nr:hypothetical protein EV178_001663 [Coemansia sp. RSA 1646]